MAADENSAEAFAAEESEVTAAVVVDSELVVFVVESAGEPFGSVAAVPSETTAASLIPQS